MDDRKNCGPAVHMGHQLSPKFVVFLLSVIWSTFLDSLFPKDEFHLDLCVCAWNTAVDNGCLSCMISPVLHGKNKKELSLF